MALTFNKIQMAIKYNKKPVKILKCKVLSEGIFITLSVVYSTITYTTAAFTVKITL